MKDKQKEESLILVQEYYTTEGENVFVHRRIGDQEEEKILTPYHKPPYVISKLMTNEEIEDMENTDK